MKVIILALLLVIAFVSATSFETQSDKLDTAQKLNDFTANRALKSEEKSANTLDKQAAKEEQKRLAAENKINDQKAALDRKKQASDAKAQAIKDKANAKRQQFEKNKAERSAATTAKFQAEADKKRAVINDLLMQLRHRRETLKAAESKKGTITTRPPTKVLGKGLTGFVNKLSAKSLDKKDASRVKKDVKNNNKVASKADKKSNELCVQITKLSLELVSFKKNKNLPLDAQDKQANHCKTDNEDAAESTSEAAEGPDAEAAPMSDKKLRKYVARSAKRVTKSIKRAFKPRPRKGLFEPNAEAGIVNEPSTPSEPAETAEQVDSAEAAEATPMSDQRRRKFITKPFKKAAKVVESVFKPRPRKGLFEPNAEAGIVNEPSTPAEPADAESQSDSNVVPIEALQLQQKVRSLTKALSMVAIRDEDDDEKVALKEIVIALLQKKLDKKLKKLASFDAAVKREKLRQKCNKVFGAEQQ